jgi:hypothetical protein
MLALIVLYVRDFVAKTARICSIIRSHLYFNLVNILRDQVFCNFLAPLGATHRSQQIMVGNMHFV